MLGDVVLAVVRPAVQKPVRPGAGGGAGGESRREVLEKDMSVVKGQAEEEEERKNLQARRLYEDYQAALRALRMLLREITLKVLNSRRWEMFWAPAEADDDEFWEKVSAPMDLSTLLYRVDARCHNTAAAYIADCKLIVNATQQLYMNLDPQGSSIPDVESARAISKATALCDEMEELVAARVPAELSAKLERIMSHQHASAHLRRSDYVETVVYHDNPELLARKHNASVRDKNRRSSAPEPPDSEVVAEAIAASANDAADASKVVEEVAKEVAEGVAEVVAEGVAMELADDVAEEVAKGVAEEGAEKTEGAHDGMQVDSPVPGEGGAAPENGGPVPPSVEEAKVALPCIEDVQPGSAHAGSAEAAVAGGCSKLCGEGQDMEVEGAGAMDAAVGDAQHQGGRQEQGGLQEETQQQQQQRTETDPALLASAKLVVSELVAATDGWRLQRLERLRASLSKLLYDMRYNEDRHHALTKMHGEVQSSQLQSPQSLKMF
eukprot:gene30290-35278_t